jgi:hypothetical protein
MIPDPVKKEISLSRRKHALLLAFFCVLLPAMPPAAPGDQHRHRTAFESEDGRYLFKFVKGGGVTDADTIEPETWTLLDTQTGKGLYDLAGRFTSKTVLVSADGRSLAVIDDFSVESVSAGLAVLAFYRDGRHIKKYTLGELLSERLCVMRTASHFIWFTGSPRIEGRALSLMTYELVTFVFDWPSGKLVARHRDPRLTDDSVFVYGRISALKDDLYQIEVTCPIYGDAACGDVIRFRCPDPGTPRPLTDNTLFGGPDAMETDGYDAVIIRDGACAAYGSSFTINSCQCE